MWLCRAALTIARCHTNSKTLISADALPGITLSVRLVGFPKKSPTATRRDERGRRAQSGGLCSNQLFGRGGQHEVAICGGDLHRPSRGQSGPRNTPMPPDYRASGCLVSSSFQARFKLVSASFQASSFVLPPCPHTAEPLHPASAPRRSPRCPTSHIESKTVAEVTQIRRGANTRRARRTRFLPENIAYSRKPNSVLRN